MECTYQSAGWLSVTWSYSSNVSTYLDMHALLVMCEQRKIGNSIMHCLCSHENGLQCVRACNNLLMNPVRLQLSSQRLMKYPCSCILEICYYFNRNSKLTYCWNISLFFLSFIAACSRFSDCLIKFLMSQQSSTITTTEYIVCELFNGDRIVKKINHLKNRHSNNEMSYKTSVLLLLT